MTYTEHYLGPVVYVAQRDGKPLYVGQTNRDIRDRICEHRQFGWWSLDVTYVVHPCRSTAAATILEGRLIAELDTPHNVNLSPSHRQDGRLGHGEAQRAAIEALRAAGRPMTSTDLRRATGLRNIRAAVFKLRGGGAIVCIGKNSTPEHGRRQSVWALAEWNLEAA